jgi:ribosomal protein S18 acetylase RimI-like enzyme
MPEDSPLVGPCDRSDADERAALLALAPRIVTGVAPWRDGAAARAAAVAWVREALDEEPGPDSALLVARLGGRVVGMLGVRAREHWTGERDAYVGELVVDPDASRRGVGRALVDAARAWAAQAGLGHLTLDTGAANTGARAFYAALGFREEAVRLTAPV